MYWRYFVFALSAFLLNSCSSYTTEMHKEEVALRMVDFTRAMMDENRALALKIHYEVEREGEKEDSGSLTYYRWNKENEYMRFRYGLFRFKCYRSAENLSLHVPQTNTLFVDSVNSEEKSFSLANLLFEIMHLPVNPHAGKEVENVQFWRDLFSANLVATSASTFVYKGAEGRVTQFRFDHLQNLKEIQFSGPKAVMTLSFTKVDLPAFADWRVPQKEDKMLVVPKGELHKTLSRALVRTAEIRLRENTRQKAVADYRLVGKSGIAESRAGERIVYLKGEPYEIGLQHGRFLADEARRTVESTLYVVGLVYSMKRSTWFLNDIRAARERLDRFIPQEYIEELKGIADGSGISRQDIMLANYFPALFHCSGFTVKATDANDNKLYHGRILDYMSNVGLQYSSVVFVIEKKNCIAFANIGYAGFAGSVSGMNAMNLSIGEMGGHGEGDWDGISMPFLIRMGLERAQNLAELKNIFAENKRTCEYYYVFADGKTRESVGVYATPEAIEFVEPGQWHRLLPNPQKDCLLLSSGSRYEGLCTLTEQNLGAFNDRSIFKLFNYPVASKSNNLHSVLFVPESLDFWVANAGANGAAYKQNFYYYNLEQLLRLNRLFLLENKVNKPREVYR